MEDKLVIWVEGSDDRRFFEQVVQPRIKSKYDQILVREYRERKTREINKLLTALPHQGFGCLLVTDMNSAPCATDRKAKLKERYRSLGDDEIIVVSKEIESWYLAGLTSKDASALKVQCHETTDALTKEDAEKLRPRRFESQLDFLIELLKYFDVKTACRRNQSFAHLCRKLALLA